MKHLDLFSGIGGFKLAAEWCGFETVAFCEVNEWCDENALKRNWPTVPNLKDVTTLCRRIRHNLDETGQKYDEVDGYVECAIHKIDFGECECIGTDQFTDTYGGVDLVTAGVPCQPASIIGKRKGVEDGRWLWPDTLRVIEELEPRWVICENPTGILTLDGGDRFGEVVQRLQQAGYGVWWETIPASAVGGGHRRERVWLIAYSGSARLEGHRRHGDPIDEPGRDNAKSPGSTAPQIVFPNRDSERWWEDQSPVPIVVDGISNPAFWKEAVIATGNAIVPQVAYQIMKGMK